MTRRRGAAAVAIGVVAAALGFACTALDARAYSASRLAVHDRANALQGAYFADPSGDVRMVVEVFALAGVARAAVPALEARGDVGAVSRALCGAQFDPAAQAPAPGDLVLYTDGAARVAVAVTATDVLLRDGGSGTARLDTLRSLVGDDRVQGAVARRGLAVGACRLSAGVVPDAGDISTAPGVVALGDVGSALAHLQDLADHPRDADLGFWHRLTSTLGDFVAGLLGLMVRGFVLLLAGSAQLLEWLHDHLGPFAYLPVALVPWLLKRALTFTVDLRPVHAVFVTVGAVLLLISPLALPVLVTTALFEALGVITGRWSPRDLTALVWAAAWNASIFGVDLLTGIDGTQPTSVVMVGFAVATDVLLFAKPVGVGVELVRMAHWFPALAEQFPRVGQRLPAVAQGLEALSWFGERVVAFQRPVSTLRNLGLLQPSALAATGVVATEAGTAARSLGLRVADLATVPWRPGATVSSQVLDLADAAARWGGPSFDPGAGGVLVPSFHAAAEISEVHGSARMVNNAIGGDAPTTWRPPRPAPPDDAAIRHLRAALRQPH